MPKLEEPKQALGELGCFAGCGRREVPRDQGLQHGMVLRNKVKDDGLTRIFGHAFSGGHQESDARDKAH